MYIVYESKLLFICLYINVKIGFADKYYRFRSVNYNLHTLVVVKIEYCNDDMPYV